MSVDKFGCYARASYKQHNLRKNITKILGIQLDSERNLNLNGKRILNVGTPISRHDAATRSSVQFDINQLQQSFLIELDKIKQEYETLKNKKLQVIEANLKSYIENVLSDHVKFIDERISKIEHYIFKQITDSNVIVEKDDDISFEKSKDNEAEYYGYNTIPAINKKQKYKNNE